MTFRAAKSGWSAKLCSREKSFAWTATRTKSTAEIDYTPISSSVVSPLWSDATNADPLANLKATMRLVSGACGYSADLIVMGKDASDAFENSAKVLSAYDKKNIAPGEITPALAEYGVTLLGNYRGLPLYASESQYTDAAGASQYYVPPDKVLVAASGLQGTLAYAGVVQVSEDESSRMLWREHASRWSSMRKATTSERCGSRAGRYRFPRTLNPGPFSNVI
jgi:hypothetical protein